MYKKPFLFFTSFIVMTKQHILQSLSFSIKKTLIHIHVDHSQFRLDKSE